MDSLTVFLQWQDYRQRNAHKKEEKRWTVYEKRELNKNTIINIGVGVDYNQRF